MNNEFSRNVGEGLAPPAGTHRRSFWAVPICRRPLGFPWGKLAAERQRSRLMRVGEQLRFAEHAKLCFSAPRPSSAPFGGTCPDPLCPFGTFPPDRGNRPRGEGMGCIPLRVRAKAATANQREGQAPPLRRGWKIVRIRRGAFQFAAARRGRTGSSTPTGLRQV